MDPHVKRCMPEGQDPKDGPTARELADQHGWDDIAPRRLGPADCLLHFGAQQKP